MIDDWLEFWIQFWLIDLNSHGIWNSNFKYLSFYSFDDSKNSSCFGKVDRVEIEMTHGSSQAKKEKGDSGFCDFMRERERERVKPEKCHM